MKRLAGVLLCGLGIASIAGGAGAHHSGAMFDRTREVTLEGTVKEFRFTNPHTWIYLAVADANGTAEWALEGGSVSALARNGWKKSSLNPGDKITVVIRPRKDGTNGGEFNAVSFPNGTTIRSNPQY